LLGRAVALGIVDHLRCGFPRFNLGAHLLNQRSLLFQARRESLSFFLLLCDRRFAVAVFLAPRKAVSFSSILSPGEKCESKKGVVDNHAASWLPSRARVREAIVVQYALRCLPSAVIGFFSGAIAAFVARLRDPNREAKNREHADMKNHTMDRTTVRLC
jgi:hypothetical protein